MADRRAVATVTIRRRIEFLACVWRTSDNASYTGPDGSGRFPGQGGLPPRKWSAAAVPTRTRPEIRPSPAVAGLLPVALAPMPAMRLWSRLLTMHWWYAIHISGWAISLILVPVLAHRYSPAKALGWLAVMFAVPWVGPVLFLMFAANPLGRRRIVRYRQALAGSTAADRFVQIERPPAKGTVAPQLGAIARAAEACGALPPSGGNAVEFSTEHEQTLEWLLRDIDAAQHHVHLVFYIIGDDGVGLRVVEALERAATRGVACRVVADALGSRAVPQEDCPPAEQ